jgi:hypothetical protein
MNGNIQGNKRTPQRFVGREAVVTTQCLNGWLVTFLLFLPSIFACFKVWCVAQVNSILMSVALFSSFVGIFCYVTKKFYQTSVNCWFWMSWLSLHAYGDTWNKICFEWVNTMISTVNKWVHLQLRWDNGYGDGYILNGVKWLSKPLVIRIGDCLSWDFRTMHVGLFVWKVVVSKLILVTNTKSFTGM